MHKQASGSKQPLHINIDETSVKLLPEQGVGYLTNEARKKKRCSQSLVYSAPRGNTRAAFSYLCMVSDDVDIQRILPQVLFVSKKVVPVKEIAALKEILPKNIHVWHGDSSWTTTDRMIAVIKLLLESVGAKLDDRQVFLTADCFRAHITQPVWKVCKMHNIFYSLVPSKMTWALQPCDTHVFASFKRRLQQRCHESMLSTADGSLSTRSVFEAVATAITEVVSTKSWAKAFLDTGLVGHQSAVSLRVLRKLGFSNTPLVGDDLPTLKMLQSVFPASTIIPITLVFGCFLSNDVLPKKAQNLRERIVTRSTSGSEAAPACSSSALRALPGTSACLVPAVPPPLPAPPVCLLRLPSKSRLPSSTVLPPKRSRSLSLPASSG